VLGLVESGAVRLRIGSGATRDAHALQNGYGVGIAPPSPSRRRCVLRLVSAVCG